MKSSLLKKVKYFLTHIDGIWSVPLGFFIFFLVGLVLSTIFGYGTGTYDVAFVQPLFLAAVVVVGATNAATIGLYFTLRGIHRYLFGVKSDNKIINVSKEDWGKLLPLQRVFISLLALFFFITLIITVYLKLV